MKQFEHDVLETIINDAAKSFCEYHNCDLNGVTSLVPTEFSTDVEFTISLGNMTDTVNGYCAFDIDMTMHGEHLTAPAHMVVVASENGIVVIGPDSPLLKNMIIANTNGKHMLTPESLFKIYPITSRNYCASTREFVPDNEDTGGFYRQ